MHTSKNYQIFEVSPTQVVHRSQLISENTKTKIATYNTTQSMIDGEDPGGQAAGIR